MNCWKFLWRYGNNCQDFELEFPPWVRGRGVRSTNHGPFPIGTATWYSLRIQASYNENCSCSDTKEPKSCYTLQSFVEVFKWCFFLLFSPLSSSHNPWLQSPSLSQWIHALRHAERIHSDCSSTVPSALAQPGEAPFSPLSPSPALFSNTIGSFCTSDSFAGKCRVPLPVSLRKEWQRNSSAPEFEPSKRWQRNTSFLLTHREKPLQKSHGQLLN